MNASNLETKATLHAKKTSENGLVFVYERNGVYWLATRIADQDGYRTLQAVGTDKTGIRAIRKEIEAYFGGK